MSKERIEKIREDLAKADAGCPPDVYCEYSCASCAADSRLEDDGVKNVRLLLAEIDRLSADNEALQNEIDERRARKALNIDSDSGRSKLGEEK